jgi:hypothetical protein
MCRGTLVTLESGVFDILYPFVRGRAARLRIPTDKVAPRAGLRHPHFGIVSSSFRDRFAPLACNVHTLRDQVLPSVQRAVSR